MSTPSSLSRPADRSQWSIAVNFNVNQYLGFSFTAPPGQNPTYVQNPPKVSAGTDNLQTVQCFATGASLVPGTIS